MEASKACHDFNNDFTLFTAVPVLFIMSVLDLKDAFHSLRLTEIQEILHNLPYFGSASYLYQRMPVELNIPQRSGNHT